jgi:hypothetical protein
LPSAGQLPADPLSDLNTRNNTLSLWQIDDEEKNLGRIAAAFAVQRGKFDSFEYVLFPETVPESIGLRIVQTDADTPDLEANSLFHVDLAQMNAQHVVELAGAIQRKKRLARFQGRELIELVLASFRLGNINPRVMSADKSDSLKKRAVKYNLEVPF